MTFDGRFEALWGKQEFEVPEPAESLCLYAKHFAEWATPVIANVEALCLPSAVNLGYLRILHKYFEWRVVVPKQHRNRVGEMGHTCIFHVFEAAYQKLKIIELSIQPPPLTLPLPPPPPLPSPPVQIAGIFLGEGDL